MHAWICKWVRRSFEGCKGELWRKASMFLRIFEKHFCFSNQFISNRSWSCSARQWFSKESCLFACHEPHKHTHQHTWCEVLAKLVSWRPDSSCTGCDSSGSFSPPPAHIGVNLRRRGAAVKKATCKSNPGLSPWVALGSTPVFSSAQWPLMCLHVSFCGFPSRSSSETRKQHLCKMKKKARRRYDWKTR